MSMSVVLQGTGVGHWMSPRWLLLLEQPVKGTAFIAPEFIGNSCAPEESLF